MKHTKEPWSINNSRVVDQPYRLVIYASCRRIALCFKEGNSIYVSEKEAEANAKRIVDCVNALEGIENPKEWVDVMRDRKVTDAMIDERYQLRARVAALEDGLKELFEAAKHCDPLFENRWSKASEKAKSLLK